METLTFGEAGSTEGFGQVSDSSLHPEFNHVSLSLLLSLCVCGWEGTAEQSSWPARVTRASSGTGLLLPTAFKAWDWVSEAPWPWARHGQNDKAGKQLLKTQDTAHFPGLLFRLLYPTLHPELH